MEDQKREELITICSESETTFEFGDFLETCQYLAKTLNYKNLAK